MFASASTLEFFTKLVRILPAQLFDQICKTNVYCRFKQDQLVAYNNCYAEGLTPSVLVDVDWFYSDILWFTKAEGYLKDPREKYAFQACFETLPEFRIPFSVDIEHPILTLTIKGDSYLLSLPKTTQLTLF